MAGINANKGMPLYLLAKTIKQCVIKERLEPIPSATTFHEITSTTANAHGTYTLALPMTQVR